MDLEGVILKMHLVLEHYSTKSTLNFVVISKVR